MEPFSQIDYKRPDMGALKKKLRIHLNALKRASSYEAARSAYLASQEESGHVETAYVVASIRNTLDTTDAFYDAEMKYFNSALAMPAAYSPNSTRPCWLNMPQTVFSGMNAPISSAYTGSRAEQVISGATRIVANRSR